MRGADKRGMIAQLTISLLLLVTLFLFIWGRWRYDIVALVALMAAVFLRLVPAKEAFLGFGHPAVITVAAVLVVGKGLVNSGVVYQLGSAIARTSNRPLVLLGGFTTLVTLLSAFMNNIGALAILMPVTMQVCRQKKISPSLMLMPLAFGSLLGGMITLIGTPPNIIIASYRGELTGVPFGMFDFTPVGLGVAAGSVLFILLIGWRLVPIRRPDATTEEMYEIEGYITEVQIPPKSAMLGKTLGDFEDAVDGDVSVLGVIRENRNLKTFGRNLVLEEEDLLIIEVNSDVLKHLLLKTGAQLVEDKELEKGLATQEDTQIVEAVILLNSQAIGKTASSLMLRKHYSVNLLAVARHGKRLHGRFGKIKLKAGDVLLLRGTEIGLSDCFNALGWLPLADRGYRIGPRRVLLSTLIVAAGVTITALGLLPVQIAFTMTALAMVMTRLLSLREVYESIDWGIIILLGAMIPLGQAFETTGAADSLVSVIAPLGNIFSPLAMLGALLVTTMLLSAVINNAAAAILMAPIATQLAAGVGVWADPYLMSVAIGASCAFLTPIGHQSNALVMGPGGYHFGDYWRLGLVLEILIVALSLPLIAYFWPLQPVGGSEEGTSIELEQYSK